MSASMVKVLVGHGILRFSQVGFWAVTFEKNPAFFPTMHSFSLHPGNARCNF
jgi:hypothetical protein